MATRRGPDGTVRVAIQGTHQGVNWANVYWCNLTGGAACSQAELDAWLVSFSNSHQSRYNSQVPNSVIWSAAKATVFQTGNTVKQSQRTLTQVGTGGATEVLDMSVCQVISWLTAVYWRGGKPRSYLPGLVTTWTTNGRTMTAAYLTNITAASVTFRNDINALVQGTITATQHGFVSFRSGNADRVPPLFFASTGVIVHPRLGSQRRRLGKWTI